MMKKHGDLVRILRASPHRPIIIVTHKRSGTHLTLDIFRRQFSECDAWKWWGENNSRLYLTLEALYDPQATPRISERQAIRVLRRCERPLVKSHTFLADLPTGERTVDGLLSRYWADWLEDQGRKLYVFRDGRDVLCSLQLLETMRDRRRWRPLSEFMREQVDGGVSRVRFWAQHVERGLAQPATVVVKFENLLDRPREYLARLGRQLDLTPIYREPLLPERLKSIWQSRWSRLFSRRPQSSAILGRPKGFKLERWQEAFDLEDREFFHQEAGATLISLGYEQSDAWVDADPAPSR